MLVAEPQPRLLQNAFGIQNIAGATGIAQNAGDARAFFLDLLIARTMAPSQTDCTARRARRADAHRHVSRRAMRQRHRQVPRYVRLRYPDRHSIERHAQFVVVRCRCNPADHAGRFHAFQPTDQIRFGQSQIFSDFGIGRGHKRQSGLQRPDDLLVGYTRASCHHPESDKKFLCLGEPVNDQSGSRSIESAAVLMPSGVWVARTNHMFRSCVRS